MIENYGILKSRLTEKGAKFRTETDTEVLAFLIGFHFEALDPAMENRLEVAVMEALREVTGTYGLVAVHQDQPDTMVGARRGSPLVLGIGAHEHFLASDVSPPSPPTPRRSAHLRDFDVVTIDREGYRLKSLNHNQAGLEISQIDYQKDEDSLGDFPHYMLKEIFEQVTSIQNAVRGRLNVEERHRAARRAQSFAAGIARDRPHSHHRLRYGAARRYGGRIYRRVARARAVEIDWASEFRLRNSPLDRRTLVLAVCQSGETEDTLGALREAHRKGHRVLGICNNVASTLARETDGGVYMYAGARGQRGRDESRSLPRPSSSSCSGPAPGADALSLRLARPGDHRGDRGAAGADCAGTQGKRPHPERGGEYRAADSMLFFGRQMQYGIALEGALKMKEITYIHAEGHPAAELKHGVIALVDEQTPSVFLCPRDAAYDKNINNMQQVPGAEGPGHRRGDRGRHGDSPSRRRRLLYSARARIHRADPERDHAPAFSPTTWR